MESITKPKIAKLLFIRGVAWVATICLFAVLAAIFSPAQLADAQESSDAAANASGQVARAVQTQVKDLLGRHLKPEEFQVFAKVVLSPTQESVPYLPSRLPPVADVNASPASLRLATKSIEVDVILADRYDTNAKSKLKEIIVRALELDESRGDKVVFSSLGLKLDRPESEVARELAKVEAEARDYKTRMEDAKREADGAKRDLALKSEMMERSTPSKAPVETDGKPAPASATPAAPAKNPLADYWLPIAGVIVGAFALFLFAIVAMRGAATKLSEAVQSIGAGIPTLGDKLGASLAQQQSPLMLPPSDNERRGQDGNNTVQALGAVGSTLPMEAVGRRVMELHDELSTIVNESTDAIMIEYLSFLLEDEALIGRAVAAMELLGNGNANRLYEKLAASHQQKVFSFLRTGTHLKPKWEVMLEAGEEIKTRLFGSSMPSRVKLDETTIQKVLLLSPDDRVAVARAVDSDSLARFFLYMDPPKIASLLGRLRERDTKRFSQALSLLVKAPDVETANHLDAGILTAVEAQLSKAAADAQGPYLAMYKSVVEAARDDELAEIMVEGLASANQRVERYMREAIVTFGTFFKLHGEIQEEIVTAFNNRDLAALVAPLKEDLRKVFMSHVEERARPLLDEEIDRLAAKGQRHLAGLHRDMKKRVVARILQIKGSGPLSELMPKKVEGLPAGSAQNTEKGTQGGQGNQAA